MEVDGVLPGDHLLLPCRSSLPVRHLSSAPGAGGGIRLGGVPRRRERKTLPDTWVAFYRSCTQNDVATWAGWCSGPLLGPSGPGEILWRVGCCGRPLAIASTPTCSGKVYFIPPPFQLEVVLVFSYITFTII